MSKRTLAIVALFCLLATAAGPPPATAAPAPLPTITEQTALVVEPGQWAQLSLWLDPGQVVTGHISVLPQDINLIVEDPDGTIVLNAGMITERDFSLVAASRGNYRFIFNNAVNRMANKVVMVQLQHPGPPLFPHFTGTYVTLIPGEVKNVPAVLNAGQAVSGSLTIQGGEHDLMFSVSDPLGKTMVPAGRVYGAQSFGFTTSAAGTHLLSFDNSSSTYMSKLISLGMSTNPGGLWWWGTATKLVFTVSPEGATAGSEFTTQPVVTVQDASGNTATNSFAEITLTVTAGTGTAGAVLSGKTTVSPMGGVANFSGLGIDLAGQGYRLTASGNGLVAASSSSFNVVPVLPPNCVALNPGWNMVSLPVIPKDTAIASVLSEITSSVLSVWRYDAASANWSNYVPGLGGALTTMTDGNAYWVNMSAPAILAVDTLELTARPAVPPAYPVTSGWNMIGFKATLPRDIGTYLVGTNYRLFPIYSYASGYFTIPSTGAILQPGRGYWVYFNAPGTIKP